MLSQATRNYLARRFEQLKRDERGDAPLANIMLLAVAALVVVGLIAFGKTAFQYLYQKWGDIKGGDMPKG